MDFKWTREPKQYSITDETIRIKTEPHTDLWQRTYYHFRDPLSMRMTGFSISVLWSRIMAIPTGQQPKFLLM